MQVKISAVVITFNEERNILRCIDSLMEVADEIIIVDSFSTDKTESICKTKNVRFIQNKFEGHIEQKNFAMTKAKYDHILSLDADEALSLDLRGSILSVKQNWVMDGYEMNRLTNYCGQWIKHCGWYPDKKLRLFKKSKGKWGGRNPHDKLIMEKGSTIGFVYGDLLHYSFYTIEEHKKQIEYFTTVAANTLHKEGKKSNWLKIFIHPIAQFLKGYFIKRGFLDGTYGFIICRLSAYANYLKYTKLLKLHRNPK